MLVVTLTQLFKTVSGVMASSRLVFMMHRFGWEFWLPLPLIGMLFWFAGQAIAEQVLSRPYDSLTPLQTDTRLEVQLVLTVLTMNAEINRDRNRTIISVRTTDSNLKNLEYEFPVIEANQIEAAIAEELNLPVERVRKLISYRILK